MFNKLRLRLKERSRNERGVGLLDELWQDLRYGVRMLMKHPGFSLIAVLTLAIGIGANTAIFSLADAVLLKLLPVRNPEQLVLLRHECGHPCNGFPYGNYLRFVDQHELFSGVLAYYPLRLTVSIDGQPEPAVLGQLVTGNYYQVLGVNAALGRTIQPEDNRLPGGHPVCVISDHYWQRRFARDPSILGKSIHLSGTPFTIIGVTPPEFFGLEVGQVADISVPAMMQAQAMPGVRFFVRQDAIIGNDFQVMGRLKPGVAMQQAQASLNVLFPQLMDELDREMKAGKKYDPGLLEQRVVLASGSQGLPVLRRQFSQPLFILMAASG